MFVCAILLAQNTTIYVCKIRQSAHNPSTYSRSGTGCTQPRSSTRRM